MKIGFVSRHGPFDRKGRMIVFWWVMGIFFFPFGCVHGCFIFGEK